MARIPNELWLTSTFYYFYTCRALHLSFDLLDRVMIRPKTLVTNEMAITTLDTARVCGWSWCKTTCLWQLVNRNARSCLLERVLRVQITWFGFTHHVWTYLSIPVVCSQEKRVEGSAGLRFSGSNSLLNGNDSSYAEYEPWSWFPNATLQFFFQTSSRKKALLFYQDDGGDINFMSLFLTTEAVLPNFVRGLV